MRKYVFLDNWVLSRFTSGDLGSQLGRLLARNNYIGLVTSLSMVELYNPGWEAAPGKDRTLSAITFLSKIPCVIVDPYTVFRSELHAYPSPLNILPTELDLQTLSDAQRAETLFQFMQRDAFFLDHGKDISIWRDNYDALKRRWLQDAKNIINHACTNGVLKQNKNGKFIDLEQTKEHFLLSLDLRHTDSAAKQDDLLAKIVMQKQTGHRVDLQAIRMTSLCVWYAYINTDPSNLPAYKPSDIGDYYHIGLIPYCAAFTLDNAMVKLVQRFREYELFGHCDLLNEAQLRTRLLRECAV